MFTFWKVRNKLSSFIYNEKNKVDLMLGRIVNVVSSVINLASPIFFAGLINALSNEEHEVEIEGLKFNMWEVTAIYCTVITLGDMINICRKKLAHKVIANAALDLQEKCIEHFMDQSYNYHTTVSPGDKNELLSICTYSTPDFVAQLIGQVVPTLFETTLAIVVLSYRYGYLPGTILGGTLAGSVFYNYLFGEQLSQYQSQFLNDRTTVARQSMASINNFEIIQMFNNKQYEITKIRNLLDKLTNSSSKALDYPDNVGLGQRAVTAVGFSGLIACMVYQITQNKYSVKDLIAIAYYLKQFSVQLNAFSDGIVKMSAAACSLSRVTHFLDTIPEIVDEHKDDHLFISPLKSNIEFKKVNFAYPDGKQALFDVSFSIPAQKQTAIVGTSGAGKSSIGKLLYRFFDIQSGAIFIGGKNIKDYSINSVRMLFSIVPQETVVFNTTLRNNIWYGAIAKTGPNPDDAKIKEVMEQTNLTNLLKQKRGLDIMVGERGLKMSGGQLQRLSIARALLKDPMVYIFDEATSALDSINADEVQEKINKVTHGHTTLVITHRLATARSADNIIVMHEGRVVEQGTHVELMSKKSRYAKLWEKQAKGLGGEDLPEYKINLGLQAQEPNEEKNEKVIETIPLLTNPQPDTYYSLNVKP